MVIRCFTNQKCQLYHFINVMDYEKSENNSKSRSHFQKGCNVGLEPTTTGTTIQDSTN